MRACGLSRQKMGYARSLAGLIGSGELDLAGLDADDEQAIANLVRIKGIGRWSAEIYLLFAEGRTDIWPAGDLAVQVEVGRLLELEDRPSEKLTRELTRLNLQISSAKISTYGEKVVDVFYVKNLFGHKVEQPAKLSEIQSTLEAVLAKGNDMTPPETRREPVAAE